MWVGSGALRLGSAVLGAAYKAWASYRNLAPVLGRKLDFALGKATGSTYNILRSKGNLAQLNRIGIRDNSVGREFLTRVLVDAFKTSGNIVARKFIGRGRRWGLLVLH